MGSSLLVSAKGARPLEHFHPAAGTPFESLTASLRLIKRLVTEQLEEERLSVTDFWAITWIGEGQSSPTALGRVLAITPAGMTQLLDRLEERGLIRRSPNPGDRRATVLALTAEGRQLQRRAGDRCLKFFDLFGRELSPQGLIALRTVSRELEKVLARKVADSARAT
jgi:DNA-binding MarR family transcriptional regulator